MVTRFVPGGYQPEHADETTRAEGAAARSTGLGDLIDDYEFHYPAELSRGQPRRGARGARRPRHLHASAPGLHLDPRFGTRRPRRPRPGDARARRCDITLDGRRLRRLARRALHHLAGDRGLQLPVPDALRASAGRWLIDGVGQAAEVLRQARPQAVPRAQELRARDEDPHAQHRHDAARHPQAARAGRSTTSRSTWTGST